MGVGELVIEARVAGARDEGDVELLSGAVRVDGFETLAKRRTEQGTVVNPIERGLDVEIAGRGGNAGTAGRNGAELVDPGEDRIICVGAIRRGENGGQDAKQVVIPLPLAGGDGGVVVFEQSPDSGQRDQVGDLCGCEAVESDAGVGVELLVYRQRGYGRRDCDRLAIDEQPKVVGPQRARAGDEDAEEKLLGVWVNRQRDTVFCPVVRALHLL